MPPLRPAKAFLAVCAVVAGILAAPTAAAGGPTSSTMSNAGAEELVARLGPAQTAGYYVDRDSDRIVVNVTDAASERAVIAAGGLARRVAFSTARLESVKAGLDAETPIRGTIFGVRNHANQVVVRVDGTVSEADIARLEAKARHQGGAMRVERMGGVLRPFISGGRYIIGATYTPVGTRECSLGFNVRDKSNNASLFFLTAGHCTGHSDYNATREWYDANGTYIGYRVGGAYHQANGFDFGLVRHYNASVSKPGNVYNHDNGSVIDITHSRDAGENEPVCNSGYRSGYLCGRVTAVNQTVTYSDGARLTGMTLTNICGRPGDSGGPLHRGAAALAIMSGGNDAACESVHQPVNEALAWYGMEVY